MGKAPVRHDQEFVVDAMLGKLAKWLRILGINTEYEYLRSAEQIKNHLREGKIVITKNQRWKNLTGLICLRSNYWMEQLKELSESVDIIFDENKLFTRCPKCNTKLVEVEKGEVYGHVPDYVLNTAVEFSICSSCGRIFWPGSHINRMNNKIREIRRIIRREV